MDESVDLPVAIGVDIGGTYTKIALVSGDGFVLRQTRLPTGARPGAPAPSGEEISAGSHPGAFLDRLEASLREMAATPPAPRGIGLALPGFLSPDRRKVIFNPNTPALVGLDISARLASIGLPVCIDQDLNTPALAEYRLGAGRGSRRLLSASIGTGLGAAVIIDGEILRFSSHTVGDSGHVILDPQGPRCLVGCRGCAEALASSLAVERTALQAIAVDDLRAGRLRAAYRDGRVPADAVIAACRAGDPLSVEIMTGVGRWLGHWLASLAPLFLPDRVVLCGGVAEAGEPLRQACQERFLELAGPEYTRFEIKLSEFKGLAGVIGAALPFL